MKRTCLQMINNLFEIFFILCNGNMLSLACSSQKGCIICTEEYSCRKRRHYSNQGKDLMQQEQSPSCVVPSVASNNYISLAGVGVGEGGAPAAGAEGLLRDGVAEQHHARPHHLLGFPCGGGGGEADGRVGGGCGRGAGSGCRHGLSSPPLRRRRRKRKRG